MAKLRVRLLLTLVVLLPVGSFADPPTNSKTEDPATDAELLEFLGGVDSGGDSQAASDDGSWIDYLSQTDIGKVARTAPGPNGSRPPQAVGTPPRPETTQDD